MIYNYMIILDALNKYTDLKWKYDDENEFFYSDHYEIVETGWYLFSLSEYNQEFQTGIWNEFNICQEESLADIIDNVNILRTTLEEIG